jgi:cephalosporin-C deacetylase-like acetyl esterase
MRNGYGHMVHDDMVQRLRAQNAARAARLRSLTSPKEALAYQAEARAAIRRAFGPWPDRSPLNARITGCLERPTHRIEKLLFESRPGVLVTANLYLPLRLDGPAPAVLGTCGHSANGKASALYQGFCQRLARAGFATLIFDPVSQGERDPYTGLPGREMVDACTRAHNMMGKQLELLGDFFGAWRAWDGIRALDYLLSRPEVDASHVGLTGNSGGGTMTTWLWALEDRFTMAAPDCFVTTFLHNFENELPADSEQYPPGVLGAGLEMADFLIAAAPKPLLLLGQHYDYFDRRGHQEAFEEVQRFYRLLGAPDDRVGCFRGQQTHGYWPEDQKAMVRFFAHHAGMSAPANVDETEVLPDKALWATPHGDTVAAGGRREFALIAERARALAAQREPLSPEAVRPALASLLQLPAIAERPYHRNLRPVTVGETTFARYAVETEGSVRAILRKRMVAPAQAHSLDVEPTVRLYLPHLSAEQDLADDPLAQQLQAEGILYALDVRGLGESAPDDEGDFWQPYGMDYMFHGYHLLLGESYLGRRVYDVLCTLTVLRREGAREIDLYGRGQGALLALLTAVLDPDLRSVTLKNGPESFLAWAETPLVAWPSACFLRGALHHLDLADCLRALAGRMTIIEPWGALMQPAMPGV